MTKVLLRIAGVALLLFPWILACSDSKDIAKDETAPATVQDLDPRQVTSRSVTLTWTAPGDDGADGQAERYEVRGSIAPAEPTDSSSFLVGEPLTKTAGSAESLLVEIERNRFYQFALRAVDEAGNWSAFSNVARVRAAVGDTIPPAAVSLAAVRVAATEAAVAWEAPGDDGMAGRAERYEARLALTELTEASWDTTGTVIETERPKASGTLELLTLEGLTPQTRYYFAVRSADEEENLSRLSNVLLLDTPSLDGTAPGTVRDLRGRLIGLYEIELTWTSPGDDGARGTAFSYDLRYANTANDLSTRWDDLPTATTPIPRVAGSRDTARVVDLLPTEPYFFGLRATDETGNESDLSNIAAIRTSDSTCVVRPDGSGDFATIADAINFGGGCRIELTDGVYTGAGNTTWPLGVTTSIHSASGNRTACVIDYRNGRGSLGAVTELAGVGLRDATGISIPASASANALVARSCRFDNVVFDPDGEFEEGPNMVLEQCEIIHAATSTPFDLDRLTLIDCVLRDNQVRIAVARELVLEDCSVFGNEISSSALFRSFQDASLGGLIRADRCRFSDNVGSIFGPQNTPVELLECLFARNTEPAVLLLGNARAEITACTFVNNSADFGVVVLGDTDQVRLRLDRSILAANRGGPVLSGESNLLEEVLCTDVYGNEGGDWNGLLTGRLESNNNLAADPLFCDPGEDDYRLRSVSPCSPDSLPECGGIGAFGVACP